VRLVHPYASKQFRLPADSDNKTDDTDLAGIFRAAVNGFGLLEPNWPDLYLQLQQLVRQRRDLVHKASVLRAQIKEVVHQLLPGYAELFGGHFFDTPIALPLARVTGSAQAILEGGLTGLQQRIPAALAYRMSTLTRVVDWARTAPAVKGPLQWVRQGLDRLAEDFLQKTSEIRTLEQESAHLLVQTPYVLFLAFPGLNVVCSADLAGEAGPLDGYADAIFAFGLARLGDIPGLTAVGAAAVLAETGDPRRYDSSSSLVKHAGLSPAENASGAFEGQAHISRRGRPGLRLAVWRAVWPLLIHNPVMAAKYAAMTAADAAAQASSGAGSRQASAAAAARARRAKARVACAASLLRWIYSMVVHGTGWDPAIASGPASCPAEAA